MTDVTDPSAAVSEPGPTRLGSRSVERPADAGSTLVAGLEALAPARVDGGGMVTPWLAGWSVDWWVGADDRWHLPAREPAVRQRRVGHGPIIETSLRVPSGDVVHTTYPVVVPGGMATVIEINNDSPVPVALAMAIRPYPVHRMDGAGGEDFIRIELDDTTVMVNAEPGLLLPRPPNEAGGAVETDLLDEIQNGRTLVWDGPVEGRTANAVCLYPLPHRTSLRFVIPGPGARPPSSEGLPDAESAARGWTAVVDRASRYEFPDSGITGLAGAARARLLLAANDLPGALAAVDGLSSNGVFEAHGAGLILEGLAIGGHRLECRQTVEAFTRSFPTEVSSAIDAGQLARGIALAVEVVCDPELDEAVLEPLTQLTHLAERAAGRRPKGDDSSGRTEARQALARVAGLVGQQDAANDLRSEPYAPRTTDLAAVSLLAEQAAPSKRWDANQSFDSAAVAARFWLAARQLVIREAGSTADESAVELLPDFPTAWRGGTVEIHEAPVAGVLVSFAIRWHGYRPALLWEVQRPDGRPVGPVRLTCPGLDPSWQTTEQKGEALLAGLAEELPEVPAPGDSFS